MVYSVISRRSVDFDIIHVSTVEAAVIDVDVVLLLVYRGYHHKPSSVIIGN